MSSISINIVFFIEVDTGKNFSYQYQLVIIFYYYILILLIQSVKKLAAKHSMFSHKSLDLLAIYFFNYDKYVEYVYIVFIMKIFIYFN